MACWANFFAKTLVEGLCWANFFAGQLEKSGAGRDFSRNSGRRRSAGRVSYRYRPLRPRAGTVLYRKRPRMRDKVLPAWVVGGGNGTKFSLLALNGPKSAFWGVPGEFCTGWAAEPGGWASFVSLRARCGLHRAFLTHIGAPPIDAAVMRCRYTCARWSCPTGQWEPHPGSARCAFIAPRKPPAHASCVGGRYRKECMGCKQTRATRGTLAPPGISKRCKQCKRHEGRKQCNRRRLTSSRASRDTRWFRAAGSRRAGRGGSRPRARGAR